MPIEVQDAFRYFSTVYQAKGQQSLFPSSLHFFSFFRVPWIFKWQYNLSQNCASRQFSVKWWDKYIFAKVQERLYTEFSAEALASPEVLLSQPEPAPQLPQAPKKLSPSPSSKGKSSSKGKKTSKRIFWPLPKPS
ncbi:hypothetical protein SLA2020_421180 [Shorea laevis]